jgi:hypothetical protein
MQTFGPEKDGIVCAGGLVNFYAFKHKLVLFHQPHSKLMFLMAQGVSQAIQETVLTKSAH